MTVASLLQRGRAEQKVARTMQKARQAVADLIPDPTHHADQPITPKTVRLGFRYDATPADPGDD